MKRPLLFSAVTSHVVVSAERRFTTKNSTDIASRTIAAAAAAVRRVMLNSPRFGAAGGVISRCSRSSLRR